MMLSVVEDCTPMEMPPPLPNLPPALPPPNCEASHAWMGFALLGSVGTIILSLAVFLPSAVQFRLFVKLLLLALGWLILVSVVSFAGDALSLLSCGESFRHVMRGPQAMCGLAWSILLGGFVFRYKYVLPRHSKQTAELISIIEGDKLMRTKDLDDLEQLSKKNSHIADIFSGIQEKTKGNGLSERLKDGSLWLLKVEWLLKRPAGWVLQRRQDLPKEAFYEPHEAVELLKSSKVAALSYKWQGPFGAKVETTKTFDNGKGNPYTELDSKRRAEYGSLINECCDDQGNPVTKVTFRGDQPDGERFHLNAVLDYYRQGSHATERPALMWDFAAVPQHNPVTGEKRTEAEDKVFRGGLSVMTNAYSSPRVLVLQHKRIPEKLEEELNITFKGKPPEDRLDLIPYSGEHCRSGWCTSETACALLMTEDGGHVCEIGLPGLHETTTFRKVPVAPGDLPNVTEMESLINDKSTRFMGKADRAVVTDTYLDMRKQVEAYQRELIPRLVRWADEAMTSESRNVRCLTAIFLFIFVFCSLGFGFTVVIEYSLRYFRAGTLSQGTLDLYLACLGVPAILFALVIPLLSRIVRAHVAHLVDMLCCRSQKRPLQYTFNWSLICSPPFISREDPASKIVKLGGCECALEGVVEVPPDPKEQTDAPSQDKLDC